MRKFIINTFVAISLFSPCYGMEPDEEVKLEHRTPSTERKMNENALLEEFVELLIHPSETTFEQSLGTSFLKFEEFDDINAYT